MSNPRLGRLFCRSVIILLLPVVLLSGILFLSLVQQERRVLLENYHQRAFGFLDILTGQSRIPLLENDVISLNTLTKTANTWQGVVSAAIIDSNSQAVAHTDPSQIGQSIQESPELLVRSAADLEALLATEANTAILARQISFKDRALGKVRLQLGLQDLKGKLSQARREVFRTLLLPVGASLALVLLLALSLSWWSRQSLVRLSRGIGRCMSGEIDSAAQERLPRELQTVFDVAREMSEKCRFELTRLKALGPADKTGFSPWMQHGQESWPIQISRTQVSVLFAGIKGFRAYAQERNPQDLLEDLNEFFELVKRSISFQGGYVDKFIGDAVIAVFTPSPEHGEHTQSAVNAALALQHVLAKTSRGGNLLLNRVGIGISSGVVLAGHFGEGEEKMHTFIGESFKAAYSLNVMAGPGEILISKEVYELLENEVSVEPVPPLEMTNTTASWENFRILRSHEESDAR